MSLYYELVKPINWKVKLFTNGNGYKKKFKRGRQISKKQFNHVKRFTVPIYTLQPKTIYVNGIYKTNFDELEWQL